MNKVSKNISKATSSSAKPQKSDIRLYYLLIFLTAFLLYANTIPNSFSFDDDYVTYHNAQIKKGIKGIPEILTSRYSLKENHTFGYRPIAKVTYAIEYQFFGENPHISHLFNIFLYALTGIFLFILLKKLFSKYNSFILLMTTLLFMAHPVHTEVVASLKNREEILSFLFSILTLITLINYLRGKKLIRLLLSILLFILAILSKLNAVIFVLIIPLALYYAFNDIKIQFPLKAFLAGFKIKPRNIVITVKSEAPIKQIKQRKYFSGQVLTEKTNIFRDSLITKNLLVIRYAKSFILSLFNFLTDHFFLISGLIIFILTTYLTKITLPWFISSLVGVYFLTRESKYRISDIFKFKYFTAILFLLSFVFLLNLDAIMAFIAGKKALFIFPPLLFIILLIIILTKYDKKEKNLLFDFISNKYLILFHYIYLLLGLITLFIFDHFKLTESLFPIIVILIFTSLLVVYPLFKKTKTFDMLKNNLRLVTGLSLFIIHINVNAAAKSFMIRESLYLLSLITVSLIFYFERNSIKLVLTNASLPIKSIVHSSELFVKKIVILLRAATRAMLNLILIYIPGPVKKLFLYLRTRLPALPKPFVFAYKTSQRIYASINPYFKLLIFVSIVFAFIAYLSIRTPDKYLAPEKIKGAVTILQNPLHYEQSTGNRIATGFSVLFFYLKKSIFPHPLLFYYGYNMIPVVGWKNITVIISFLIHLFLIVFSIIGIKKKSIFSFGIIFYLVSISVFSNLFIPINGIVGERFLFVPSLGYILVLVFFVLNIFKTDLLSAHFDFSKNIKPLMLLSVIFIFYSYKTIDRNSDWKNQLSLYSSDILYLENSGRANVIYAGTMYGELFANLQPGQNISSEQMDKAGLIVKYYKQGLTIDPTYSNAWNNLGITYVLVYKSTDQGIDCFKKAVKYDSTDCETYFNLGFTYELIHDSIKAEQSYRKSLDINIQYPKSFMSLNNLLMKQNRYQDVTDINTRLMKANPGLDIPFINLGNVFLMQTDTSKCLEYWEKAYSLNPENMNTCNNLAGMYQLKKEYSKSSFYSGQLNKLRESARNRN